ncbi:MAG: HD domain-containing protein, partial [Firmicutes bacterium]|nr:HD domain-containing protein [Bacillota bacterium]
PVSVKAIPRGSTWGKIFDFENEGLTENNYQAYTYDFTVKNNTGDEVKDFSFKMTFDTDVYLLSAWNGALEIHQLSGTEEITDTVPDLREFIPEDYKLNTVTVDGESLIKMKSGDFFVYIPSSAVNAVEVPIEAYEATTPGIIMYVETEDNIEGSTLEIEYTFRRAMTGEPLFWVSIIGLIIWLTSFFVSLVTAAEIKKYNERHERDNVIINESIETFTGFIDAKDKYTNGHSKRVAVYTKRIAEEFGYSGEELDRIYYIALLHDCGKIGVPDNILCKPGRLTDEEFERIKSHTILGGEILSHFKSLKDADEGALYHHERYDGRGYPKGKAGEDIPFIARMICVADSYDAMNTDRVYRKKLSKEQIISELENNKGKQFDPKVADVMLDLLKNDDLPNA